jgi:hypothetical protein
MSQCIKTDNRDKSGARIEDLAQRALDLREMAFEFGDPSLIKAIDLMMYCIGKAVARERLAAPAPVAMFADETLAAPAVAKRRRSVRPATVTSAAA